MFFFSHPDSCDNLQKGKFYECISPYEQCSIKTNCKQEIFSLQVEDLKNIGGGIYSVNNRKYDIGEVQINTVNERFYCQHVSTQFTKHSKENHNIKYNKCVNSLATKPQPSDSERDVLTKNSMRKIKTFPKLTSESETDPSIFFPSVTHSGLLMRKHPLKPKLFSVITNNEHTALEGKLSPCDANNQLGLKPGYFEELNINGEESSFHQLYMPVCVGKKTNLFTYSPAVSQSSDNSSMLKRPDKSTIAPQTPTWEYSAETSPQANELSVYQPTTALTATSVNGCGSGTSNYSEQNCIEMKDCCIEDEQEEGREAEKKSNEQVVETNL